MEHCLTPGNYPTRAGEPRPYPWQSVPAGNLTSGGFGTRPYEVGVGAAVHAQRAGEPGPLLSIVTPSTTPLHSDFPPSPQKKKAIKQNDFHFCVSNQTA